MVEHKANILLVDDQPSNLLALEAILDSLGQNLVRASSGEEGLKRLLDDDFAVILMDVKMPGLDGIETAALIRARDRCQHTPIIFLTAFECSDVQVFKGYSLGAVDYLFKPPQPDVLRSKVAVFVELHRKTVEIKRQGEQLRLSERRELEQQLTEERQRWEMERLREEARRERKAAEDLKEADRRKDEFLALLAHELRNPLAPITNALHLLRAHADNREALNLSREIIERQVKHMTRLIDDLVDVSRINSGKIKLLKVAMHLASLVEQAVESTAPLIHSRRQELIVALPPGPIRLFADPVRLAQVLSNLLNNAARYTPEGGRIWLTAEVVQDQSAHKEEIVLCVRDNGIGIPETMLERIFDLFVQVDRSLSSATQWGLGIGLALVRRLVEMHGGRITATSSGPDQGSEFVLRLPLLKEADGGEESVPQAAGPALDVVPPGRRVLLVDDSHDAAESLALLLRRQGHEVRVVHDGTSALDAARDCRPEVALLDIGLPGLDGYEVARRLRQDPLTSSVYLVAMTGFGQEEARRRSQEAGFDCHLVKPVDPDAVQKLLRQREATPV